MKVTAIIPARMASTRLPGKVLADIAGRPMLTWVCGRVELIRAVYVRLGGLAEFGWEDVRQVLAGEPALNELNRHVRRKELTEG